MFTGPQRQAGLLASFACDLACPAQPRSQRVGWLSPPVEARTVFTLDHRTSILIVVVDAFSLLPEALRAHALHFRERAQGVLALASTPDTFAVDALRLDPGGLRDGLPGHLEKHLVFGVLV